MRHSARHQLRRMRLLRVFWSRLHQEFQREPLVNAPTRRRTRVGRLGKTSDRGWDVHGWDRLNVGKC